MKRPALATILLLSPFLAFAQTTDSDSRVEVWGLQGETQEEFEARHRAATGHGLEGACMATLKGRMGYRAPGVYVFPNPASPDSTTMLVTIGDVPAYRFPMTENESRPIVLPESWAAIRGVVATELGGFHASEFFTAIALFAAYRRGDSGTVTKELASHSAMFASFGSSIDSAKVARVLAGLVEAGTAPVEETIDIYLHSDSLAHRSLAAHVLRNHLEDARAIEALTRSIWDRHLGGDARKALTWYLRTVRAEGFAPKHWSVVEIFDGELVGAMLNHPSLEMCDLALEVLASDPRNDTLIAAALAGGASTLKHYLRSRLTKHSEFARDFSADAIEALRRISAVDHGSDPERWVAWIDSFTGR